MIPYQLSEDTPRPSLITILVPINYQPLSFPQITGISRVCFVISKLFSTPGSVLEFCPKGSLKSDQKLGNFQRSWPLPSHSWLPRMRCFYPTLLMQFGVRKIKSICTAELSIFSQIINLLHITPVIPWEEAGGGGGGGGGYLWVGVRPGDSPGLAGLFYHISLRSLGCCWWRCGGAAPARAAAGNRPDNVSPQFMLSRQRWEWVSSDGQHDHTGQPPHHLPTLSSSWWSTSLLPASLPWLWLSALPHHHQISKWNTQSIL